MKVSTDLKKIYNILNRGTVEVVVKTDLEQKLLSGKRLNIKLGIDPSGSDLHIGHMVVVRKLKEFQDLGHHVILLFGNFTGQIGDPTDKKETRRQRTQPELELNAQHYLDQVKKVLDISQITVRWNADWLSKLTFSDVVQLASHFTVAQMLERDMFQERIKVNAPISLHEFMYPLMQGYDSVALNADVELGGTDQTFNLLAGRVLQRGYGQEPQNIVTVPILEGLDGKLKMGKSTGNYIGVNDDPKIMYGKVMSLPDEMIVRYFQLATSTEMEEIIEIQKQLEAGQNPRDIKMDLARRIVVLYHGQSMALEAEKEFIEIFSNKGLPETIERQCIGVPEMNILDLLFQYKLTASKGDARRLILQGGVKVDGVKILDINFLLDVRKERVLQVGKRKFLKVIEK